MGLSFQVLENPAGEILVMVNELPGNIRFELVGNAVFAMRGRKMVATIDGLSNEVVSSIKKHGGSVLEFTKSSLPGRSTPITII